ncbi:hypothetical protein TorRG33x02_172520 [Trema orientale]|uniref:Uncharacterized protein n=1 Tax=Trema orientale TaxID=63057 RepID=A0A2P5ENF9_TREOI|nr:hypothetical protein TorRG33x02_172520 [Trema orientale]
MLSRTRLSQQVHQTRINLFPSILRVLEEDAEAEELNNFARGPDIEEVGRYCEWLQKNQYR